MDSGHTRSKAKKLLNAQKNLVEKCFLEVKDDLYIFSLHDAGQTGHDPDN